MSLKQKHEHHVWPSYMYDTEQIVIINNGLNDSTLSPFPVVIQGVKLTVAWLPFKTQIVDTGRFHEARHW